MGAGKYKASHDSLTGLLNRDQFYEDVHDMVNKYHDTTFYLICSNIKDFKFINEIFGMEKGNQVLIKQAKLMASNPSERTICARLMNDRFALCLPREEFDEKEWQIQSKNCSVSLLAILSICICTWVCMR